MGGTDGAIDLTVTGGVGPFSFQWSTGSGEEDVVGLMAGEYAVTVTDACGLTTTAVYIVGTASDEPCITCDTIVYGRGWSYISFDVQPDGNAALVSNVLANEDPNTGIFAIERIDGRGRRQIYTPFLAGFSNNDFALEPGAGYRVYTFNRRGGQFILCGDPVSPDTRVAIRRGITYVGHVPQQASTPADFFGAIPGFFYAYTENTAVYRRGTYYVPDPQFASFNTMPEVLNGLGYAVFSFSASGDAWREAADANGLAAAASLDEEGYVASQSFDILYGEAPALAEGTKVAIVDDYGTVHGELTVGADGVVAMTYLDGFDEFTGEYPDLPVGTTLYFEHEGRRSTASYVFTGEGEMQRINLEFATTSSSNETVAAVAVTAFPNPFAAELNVQIGNLGEAAGAKIGVSLVNTLGQEVLRRTDVEATSLINLRTADLPAGVYLLRVTADGRLLKSIKVQAGR